MVEKKLIARMSEKILRFLKNRFDIDFNSNESSILNRALVHSSVKNKQNNEKLETLGDAVFNLIITEELFYRKKEDRYKEKDISIQKNFIVSSDTLYEVAKSIDLNESIQISKGESNNQGKENQSIIANTMEALIGALFLTKGLEVTKKIVLSLFHEYFEKNSVNYKAKLQEYIQKRFGTTPVYKIISISGKANDPIIELECCIKELNIKKTIYEKNKKLAEKKIASIIVKDILKLEK